MWKTSYPLASSQRRRRSSNRKVRKFPYVGIAIDGRTAGIERYPAGMERLKWIDSPGERVVEPKGHAPAAPAAAVVAMASPGLPPLIVT